MTRVVLSVDVERRHVREGQPEHAFDCVLARALTEKYGGRWEVTGPRAVWHRRRLLAFGRKFRVGAAGRQLVRDVDGRRHVRPQRVALYGTAPAARARRPAHQAGGVIARESAAARILRAVFTPAREGPAMDGTDTTGRAEPATTPAPAPAPAQPRRGRIIAGAGSATVIGFTGLAHVAGAAVAGLALAGIAVVLVLALIMRVAARILPASRLRRLRPLRRRPGRGAGGARPRGTRLQMPRLAGGRRTGAQKKAPARSRAGTPRNRATPSRRAVARLLGAGRRPGTARRARARAAAPSNRVPKREARRRQLPRPLARIRQRRQARAGTSAPGRGLRAARILDPLQYASRRLPRRPRRRTPRTPADSRRAAIEALGGRRPARRPVRAWRAWRARRRALQPDPAPARECGIGVCGNAALPGEHFCAGCNDAIYEPRPAPGPVLFRPDTSNPVSRKEDPVMSSHIDAAAEAIDQHIGAWQPENAIDLDLFLAGLPRLFESVAGAIGRVGDTLGEQFPVDHAVTEALRELAATAGGMAETASEAHTVHRTAHAQELERIENPRPGERLWDVVENQ